MLFRYKLASSDGLAPPHTGSAMRAVKQQGAATKGSSCHPGVLLLLLAVACLAIGFAAGTDTPRSKRAWAQELIITMHAGRIYAQSKGYGLLVTQDGSKEVKTSSTSTKTGGGGLSPFTSLLKTRGGAICKNTCSKANDGVCDDGRVNVTLDQFLRAPSTPVVCDLGTDCADCGPWRTLAVPAWDNPKVQGPIALLQGKKVEVRVKPTTVMLETKGGKSAFKFAYTDPKKDLDVSSHMEEMGCVELSISKIFYHIFHGRCIKPDGSRALFVDVGANFGWFTILAATMGCRVIAFEPVPHFRAFLEYNVHVNNLGHLVDIRGVVVSNQADKPMNMVVPSAGIWGTAGIDGLNIDQNIPGSTETMSIPSVTLDKAVTEDVLLMKVDVEGWEWSVMQGAREMLKKYKVENIVMEYSPGVAERNFRHNDSVATVQMLVDLIDSGFRIAHLQDRTSELGPISAALGQFEEVTKQNLKYDMKDVMLLKENKLGCPLPQEIRMCGGAVPEDLSPRSLRSIFGHNTNLWASKNQGLQKLNGTVGFIKIDDLPNQYTITRKVGNELYGMGFRRCSDMQPQWQVRHRCPCSNKAVCGPEEDLVRRLAAEGKIASSYILP